MMRNCGGTEEGVVGFLLRGTYDILDGVSAVRI